jgi:parallel beta-helix repeat protein
MVDRPQGRNRCSPLYRCGPAQASERRWSAPHVADGPERMPPPNQAEESKMNKPVKMLLCALSLLLASGFAGHATAGCIGQVTATDFHCGDTVTESCTMNENLTTTEITCFEIGANNIVLDGNGHSITGPYVLNGTVGQNGKGIDLLNHDHVTTRNLTISGFYWGISLYNGTYCTLQGNSVNGAYFGIELRGVSTDNTVKSNSVTGAMIGLKVIGSDGVVDYSSTNNTISENIVSGGSRGIYLSTLADGNLLEKNQVTSNQFNGIQVTEAERNTLLNNVVTGSGWDGIALYRSPGTTIRYNQVSNNTYYGIGIEDCSGNTIEYNKVSGNPDAGIHFAPDAPDNILVGNKICNNTGGASSFDINDEAGNRGSSNTCGTNSGYNDSDAAAGCAFACGCGCDTGTTIYDCGSTIAASCTVNCDLVSFGSCFQVGADSIIVDGNGFAIHGNGTGTGINAVGIARATIRNFDIDNFVTGIALIPKTHLPAKASTQNRLLNNRVDHSSQFGIYLSSSTSNTLDGNTVKDNNNGISLQNLSTGNSLSSNIAARSAVDGFYFAASADSNTLAGNTSCASGNLDVNNLGTNTGTGTTCLHTGGTYNDTGRTGCTYACGICSDGTFYGECSLQKPKFCMEGTLIDDCVRCGCDSDNCNPANGACEAVPPPSGKCVGATKQFACGDSVTESCTLNGHMASAGTCLTITANNVTIDGAGYTITGDKTGKAVTTMVHDNIVVRNLLVKNFYAGIDLYYSNGSRIEDCSTIDNEGPGIWLRTHTTNTIVRNNTVQRNDGRGIWVDGVENNTIETNTITQNKRGIYVRNNSSGNVIKNNTINDNEFDGIVVSESNGNTFSGNYLARNTVEGMALYESDNNTIQSNNIRHHPERAIFLSESHGNVISGNFVTDTQYDGIYLYLSNSNQLTGNSFCDNGDGTVYFDIDSTGGTSGSNNMCRNAHNYNDSDAGAGGGCARQCAVYGCDTGTTIYKCGDTVMQSCTMTGTLTSPGTCFTVGANNVTINGNGFGIVGNNQFDTYGVYAAGRSNVTVNNLEIYDFYGGVYFDAVAGSAVTSNKLHSNKNGAMLAFSSNNQITSNTVNSNQYAGILLAYNSGNNVVNGNTADGNGFGIRLLFNSDQNTLTNNKIFNSTENGVYFDFDTNLNQLLSNTICGNLVDIYQDGSNTGDNNYCKSIHNWNDVGAAGCTFVCPGTLKGYPWIPLLLLD